MMAYNCIRSGILRRLMSTSVNTQLAESIKNSTISERIPNIEEVLASSPELNGFTIDQWESRYKFFENHGFNMLKFTQMIQQNPTLMRKPENVLNQRLELWRSLKFGDMKMTYLLSEQPELFDIEQTKPIFSKISIIQSVIGQNENNLHKLLISSPHVLTKTHNDLYAMALYLTRNLKIQDKSEIYKSSVMAKDLAFLKTRYTFMNRLGLYVVKRIVKPTDINKNPKLANLVDTDDKRFATKVCRVTLEEYEVFKELYEREFQDEEDKDDLEIIEDEDEYFEVKNGERQKFSQKTKPINPYRKY